MDPPAPGRLDLFRRLAMKPLDWLFQALRVRQVRPHIKLGARVLDVGCGDGGFFLALDGQISEGVGIDTDLRAPVDVGVCRLLRGAFPDDLPEHLGTFDAITMMAVLEHVPPERQPALAAACRELLRPGGRLIITVPSPLVDHILHLLKYLPFLYEGRSLEQHYGYDAQQTPAVFAGLTLLVAKRFEFGLNHLFVFERSAR